MPELPEVETIRKDLQRAILGARITKVCVHNPRVIREPSPGLFERNLQGLAIRNVLRRGKLLILELSNGSALAIHLKMTGQLVLGRNPGNPRAAKISRVVFHLSGGKALGFNDQRLFGELRLVDDWSKIEFVQRLGPDPLDLTYEAFKSMFLGKKTGIKPLLMDQSFISGIGNLYAAEILFRAKIDPRRPAGSLNEKERKALYKEMRQVLKKAIQYGGSSVDDYVRLSGKPGDYVRFHRVYGRQGKPCFVCKGRVQRIVQGGRGTYFCPKCQR